MVDPWPPETEAHMTGLDALRTLVDAAPVDAVVTVPVRWLREVLEGAPESPDVMMAPDLSAAAFAQRFGRSASTVRLWCESGKVPGAWKLNGKEWRIPVAAIEQFRQMQGAPAPNAVRPSNGDLGDWRRAKRPA
jgi:hypothetical protein